MRKSMTALALRVVVCFLFLHVGIASALGVSLARSGGLKARSGASHHHLARPVGSAHPISPVRDHVHPTADNSNPKPVLRAPEPQSDDDDPADDGSDDGNDANLTVSESSRRPLEWRRAQRDWQSVDSYIQTKPKPPP